MGPSPICLLSLSFLPSLFSSLFSSRSEGRGPAGQGRTRTGPCTALRLAGCTAAMRLPLPLPPEPGLLELSPLPSFRLDTAPGSLQHTHIHAHAHQLAICKSASGASHHVQKPDQQQHPQKPNVKHHSALCIDDQLPTRCCLGAYAAVSCVLVGVRAHP
jgi:hypothetical protein